MTGPSNYNHLALLFPSFCGSWQVPCVLILDKEIRANLGTPSCFAFPASCCFWLEYEEATWDVKSVGWQGGNIEGAYVCLSLYFVHELLQTSDLWTFLLYQVHFFTLGCTIKRTRLCSRRLTPLLKQKVVDLHPERSWYYLGTVSVLETSDYLVFYVFMTKCVSRWE